MKKLRGLLFGVIATTIMTPFTLAGCSETTRVEEKVNVGDDTTPVVTEPKDDVNVNVKVEGNNAPPQIIEKKEIIHETTNVTNVQPVTQPEKKVEVHNHVTNVNPPNATVQKEVSVNTDSSGTVTGTTQTVKTTNTN